MATSNKGPDALSLELPHRSFGASPGAPGWRVHGAAGCARDCGGEQAVSGCVLGRSARPLCKAPRPPSPVTILALSFT